MMGRANPLERLGIERLIAQAEAQGVPVPDEIRALLSDGHARNTGAWLWVQAHPEDADTVRGCCIGEAVRGAEHCTCWVPVWNGEQAEPVLPPKAADLAPFATKCGDCAYRRDSPERRDEWMADTLYSLPEQGTAFYCHEGMRRPVAWRHPDGREIAGSPDDWQPPMVAGIPYRLDGRAGSLCAGWAAIRAARRTPCTEISEGSM